MKRLFGLLFPILLVTAVSACGPGNGFHTGIPQQPGKPGGGNDSGGGGTGGNDGSMKLRIRIGSEVFTASLADNRTAETFKELLPATFDMQDLNGNEKYCSLSRSLPTTTYSPGTINNGDIMLFGSGTLVLFYKAFSNSYGYSLIGRVDNPPGLEIALGSGNATVEFELIE